MQTALYLLTWLFLVQAQDLQHELLGSLSEIISGHNNILCKKDMLQMFTDYKYVSHFRMLDSFGKPSSGIGTGNFRFIGSQQECQKASVPPKTGTLIPSKGFNGKYCILHWELSFMKTPHDTVSVPPMQSGACVPDSCKEKDVQANYELLCKFIKTEYPDYVEFIDSVKLQKVSCPSISWSPNVAAIATLLGLGLLLCLSLYTTADDYFGFSRVNLDHVETGKKGIQGTNDTFLSCFSLVKNARTILNTNSVKQQMTFIHGLKVLSMCWIILGHFNSLVVSVERNPFEHLFASFSTSFQFVTNGYFAVGTFFFISAFLLVHNLLENSNSKLSVTSASLFIIYRYFRTAPCLLVMLALFNTIVLFLGYGPLWSQYVSDIQLCSGIWWTFPLCINNFFNEASYCYIWLWYFAADFQLFIAALLVLSILQRSYKWGIVLSLLLILGTTIASASIIYVYDIIPVYDMQKLALEDSRRAANKLDDFFRKLISIPYSGGVTYWFGFLYAIYTRKRRAVRKLQAPNAIMINSLSLLCLLFIFCVLFPYYVERGKIGNMIFTPMSFIAWAGVVGLTFHICLHKPQSFVNRLLSWKKWGPLSRLTYSAYLIHSLIMNWIFWNTEQLRTFRIVTMWTFSLGIIITTFACSFFLSVFVEAPFVNFIKLMLVRKKHFSVLNKNDS